MVKTLPELEQEIKQFYNDQTKDSELAAFARILERTREETLMKLVSVTTDENILYLHAIPTSTNPIKIRGIAEQRLKELYPERYRKIIQEHSLQKMRRH
jgi:hypothetical protein